MTESSKEHAAPEVSPQAKLAALQELLPFLDKSQDLIISGSLSGEIARLQQDGVVVLTPENLTRVGDLDIGTTGWGQDPVNKKADEVAKKTGFQVEVSPIAQNCAYPSSGQRTLAVASVDLRIAGDATGNSYRVQYTTPEFLLLSLADQEVTEKTPSYKFRRKVLAIQGNPAFSQERFARLVRGELAARFAMNSDTFRFWKETMLRRGARVDLKEEFENVSSLMDEATFFNLVKSAGDLRDLDFTQVRKIPSLERFLKQMEGEE